MLNKHLRLGGGRRNGENKQKLGPEAWGRLCAAAQLGSLRRALRIRVSDPLSTGAAVVGTAGCQRECQKIRGVNGSTQWSVPHQKEDRLSRRKVR